MNETAAAIERVKEAMKLGPTPGPWEFGSFATAVKIVAETRDKYAPIAVIGEPEIPWNRTEESTRVYNDAAYIAACNPSAMALILAELDRLAAVPEGWKTIDSAPKDGTRVLLGRFTGNKKAEHEGLCKVDWYRQPSSSAGYVGFGYFNMTHWPATHWMPLPAAPSLPQSATKEQTA